MDVGDFVYVVFWRPFPMPGNPNNGSWDLLSGRIVSIGRDNNRICYAIDNPSLPGHFGGEFEAPPNSPLRFANTTKVFLSREDAENHARSLSPPA